MLFVSIILFVSSQLPLSAQTVDSSIVIAVLEGNLQKFNEFVQKGAELNLKDNNDYTLLMYAASNNYPKIISALA